MAHFARTVRRPFAYDGDAGVQGNLIQQNVAAYPASAASGRSERWGFFECRQGESEMGNEKNRSDGPRVEVVVQDEEIGSSVFEDGALHFGIRGVENARTEGSGLAFELERRGTQ